MNTLNLGRKDFVEIDGCLNYEHELKTDGHLSVEGGLGWIKFKFGINVGGSIIIEAGSGIEAGEGIEAGWGIKAGWDIKAGWGIEAGEGIKAGLGIEAGEGIKAGLGIEAGWGIKAGEGIEAGWGIKAGEGIEAGEGIKAGWGIEAGWDIKAGEGIEAGEGIISLYSGLRAKVVSCLRIAIGFHSKSEQLIEAKIEKGDVILGKVSKPNPLPPVEYYWHIHHEQLVEATYEPIENRIFYIKSDKPKHEIETRLRLLRKVEDQTVLRKAMNSNDHEAVDELHKKECKDCSWNGHTIFPKSESKS